MSRRISVVDLGEGEAAALLDRLDAESAVAVAARQDRAGGVLAAIERQGTQEDVDRLAVGRPEPSF